MSPKTVRPFDCRPTRLSGGSLSKARRIPLGRHIWQPVLALLIWLLLRVEVRGGEHVPASGAGIVYYNHIHWLDPVLICGTIRRYAVPLTKIETRHWPVVGWLLLWYHVIFIRRGVVDRSALQATWDVLDAGHVSVISPEGTRSMDGRLQAAKEGLGFIARHVPDAWLIPCAVTGTPVFNFKQFWRRPRVVLSYGRPFRFCWPQDNTSREALREMTDEAMVQLSALVPPDMRGDYTGRDPSQHSWLRFLDD
jgi:1-acyl-sn-glycerol-3-phosphate acyltransferase